MIATSKFDAFRIHAPDHFERAGIETLTIDELSPGDVVIEVQYSSVNYKDALAGTGRGKILRASPLNGGIDLGGVVVESSSPMIGAGQPVLLNGSGLGETHDGGYSRYARVPAEWVVPMPKGLDARSAMIIGTAGFTAALGMQRMFDNHQSKDDGPILVTGATGGVGSFAISLLSQMGFEVVAMTRKMDASNYLQSLGASRVIDTSQVQRDKGSLQKGLWAGAVDNVGGETLAWLTKSVKPWGNIVSVGMAGGVQVETTTMPFILRGVSILGVTSAMCPQPLRKKIWQRLGNEWKPADLERICAAEVNLSQLPMAFDALLKGEIRGRQIVCLG